LSRTRSIACSASSLASRVSSKLICRAARPASMRSSPRRARPVRRPRYALSGRFFACCPRAVFAAFCAEVCPTGGS
jgi:hypothetical protein